MISVTKTLLAAAPLLSLAASRILPAPVQVNHSQPYDRATSKTAVSANSNIAADDVANCDHCYTWVVAPFDPSCLSFFIRLLKHFLITDFLIISHLSCFTFFPPAGEKFVAFVGNMIVPQNDPSNSQATNFVWPGLQNSNANNNLFVLQPVLNGFPADNGAWSTFENYLVSGAAGRNASKCSINNYSITETQKEGICSQTGELP